MKSSSLAAGMLATEYILLYQDFWYQRRWSLVRSPSGKGTSGATPWITGGGVLCSDVWVSALAVLASFWMSCAANSIRALDCLADALGAGFWAPSGDRCVLLARAERDNAWREGDAAQAEEVGSKAGGSVLSSGGGRLGVIAREPDSPSPAVPPEMQADTLAWSGRCEAEAVSTFIHTQSLCISVIDSWKGDWKLRW